MPGLNIFGVPGLPEIVKGSDLATMIADAAAAAGTPLESGDIVVITSKIVSKAEGRVVELEKVVVSPFARQYAEKWEKEPAVVELVLQESRRVVRQVGPIMITETRHGFICANAGIDQSSSGGEGLAVLLPVDPDASAAVARKTFLARGLGIAVIVSDTFGRPWRDAQTDIAIASPACSRCSATSARWTRTATNFASRRSARRTNWPARLNSSRATSAASPLP